MIVLKKYDTPTDLYIFGDHFESLDKAFGITDDYHSLMVSNGKKSKYMDTIGHIFILTKEEMDNMDEVIEDGSQEAFVLKNYVGELRLKVITYTSQTDILHEYDPNEYLMYQEKMRDTLEKEHEDDSCDYVLEFDGEMPEILTTDEVFEQFRS